MKLQEDEEGDEENEEGEEEGSEDDSKPSKSKSKKSGSTSPFQSVLGYTCCEARRSVALMPIMHTKNIFFTCNNFGDADKGWAANYLKPPLVEFTGGRTEMKRSEVSRMPSFSAVF
jgi:hypothetical protein